MSVLSTHFKKLDWGIIISALMLVAFGLSSIYSYSLAKSDFLNLEKQIIFFIVGFGLMLLISFFDYRLLRNNSHLILVLYGLCLIFLAGFHFFARVIGGKRGGKNEGRLTKLNTARIK